MIRVALPYHLRNLARVQGEVELDVGGPATVGAVLDALEARFQVLRGTIRDHGTLRGGRGFGHVDPWRHDLGRAMSRADQATVGQGNAD